MRHTTRKLEHPNIPKTGRHSEDSAKSSSTRSSPSFPSMPSSSPTSTIGTAKAYVWQRRKPGFPFSHCAVSR